MKRGNNAVIKNSFWLLSESIITMLISLLIGVVSARYLGPGNYGLINRFTPYISLANSICTFGLQSIIIRDISRNDSAENVRKILGSTLFFRLVLSIISIVCIDAYAFVISKQGDSLLFIIAILQSFSLVFNCYEIITYYFHAMLQSKYIAIATVLTSALVGVWKIALLISKASVEWFAFSTTLQAVLLFGFNYFFFRRSFRAKLKADWKMLKTMIGDGYHLLLASMGIAVYGQVDKIMIGSILGNKQLGYYTAAYAIATLWYFVPSAISNSMRSKIFSACDDEEEYGKSNRVLFLIVTGLGVCAGIGFMLIPTQLIGLLYGAEYLDAKVALMILGWCGLFANIGTARSIWLVGKGLHRYSKNFTLMGAMVNIVLNALLIPWIGINGAAIATVISQFSVQMVFPLFFKDTRQVVIEMVTCYREVGHLKRILMNFLSALIQKKGSGHQDE